MLKKYRVLEILKGNKKPRYDKVTRFFILGF